MWHRRIYSSQLVSEQRLEFLALGVLFDLPAGDESLVEGFAQGATQAAAVLGACVDEVKDRPKRLYYPVAFLSSTSWGSSAALWMTRMPGTEVLRRKLGGTVMWSFDGMRSESSCRLRAV